MIFWPQQLAVTWDQRADRRTRRALLHLQYSYAAPFGPALLVTPGPKRTGIASSMLPRRSIDYAPAARFDQSDRPCWGDCRIRMVGALKRTAQVVERLLVLLRLAHRWAPSAGLLTAPMEPSLR
jgi:hypothetical protein